MKKIKNFKGFLNEIVGISEDIMVSPEDIFSYMDLQKSQDLYEDKWILYNMSEINEVFEDYFSGDDIAQYFEKGNAVSINIIDNAWEIGFDCDVYEYDFIEHFVKAIENLLGKGNVFIDDYNISKYLTESYKKIKESIGDLQQQFVGNGFNNVNVKQIAGGIELSSHSDTDIYNLKQIHGGEIIEKDGVYILYIKDKKVNEDLNQYDKQSDGDFIEIYDDFSHNLVAEFEGFDGVFFGSDYAFDSENEDIKDISDSYTLSGEMSPKELNDMLKELSEFPFLSFVGYPAFREKFDFEM